MATRATELEASQNGYGSIPANNTDDVQFENPNSGCKCTSKKLFGYAVFTGANTILGTAAGAFLGIICGGAVYASYEAEGKDTTEAALIWKVMIAITVPVGALLGFLYEVRRCHAHRNER